MWRRLGVVAAVALSIAVAAPAQAAPLAREQRVVLPASQVPKLVRQCSRRRPGPVEGTWTPSAAQLDQLEARLPVVFLENLERAHGGHLAPGIDQDALLASYYRQYAGLVIAGRRVIYLHAFRSPHSPLRRDWRREPIIVCDGGTITFGVEYDPARRTFANFAFNGSLRRPAR